MQKRQLDPIQVFTSFTVPGHPTATSPFIVFAKRILSVSANSASCERLFSIFGNILTKVRNRTGDPVLVNLSKVKMHVRDEHIANGIKTRIKREFSAKSSAATTAQSQSGPSSAASASVTVPVDTIINGVQCAFIFRIQFDLIIFPIRNLRINPKSGKHSNPLALEQ
jgi:hypothetical protein